MPRHTLDDYLSFKDAMAYMAEIGSPVAEGTWKSHVYAADRITPIGLGERVRDGVTTPHTICFTKRMLREYANGTRPVEPTAAERDGIVTIQDAAALAGISEALMRHRVFVKKSIPHKTIGRVAIVLRRDADKI